jgi:chemotaxis-related protein WspB
MLFVLIHVRGESYAIAATQVVEIVPKVKLRSIPKSPDYVAGLMNYRGAGVPVLDLCALFAGKRCKSLFSSRIVLVNLRDGGASGRVLGLLAERVVETIERSADDFHASGVSNASAPYLSEVATVDERLVQRIDVDALLPDTVRGTLFR